jgi:hypothetical protein
MKTLLFVLICISSCFFSSAQGRSKRFSGSGQAVSWDDQVVIVDKNGGSFHSYYEGVDGHPFFIEKFTDATIGLRTGAVFNGVKARIDLCKQEIHFRLPSDSERIALPGLITEIILYDTVKSAIQSYKFQSGYPEVDNLKRDTYYEVLSDGKITLLKSSIKKINKSKNEMSGEVSSQFDTYEDHYLYVKYEMKRIKKDKEYLLDLLADKRKEMETYAKDQKLNFKSIDSIKKLVDYYNTLFTL